MGNVILTLENAIMQKLQAPTSYSRIVECYLVFMGMRHGTESRMHELVPGSAGSTMTKGLSSKVTTLRCCASSKGFRKEP